MCDRTVTITTRQVTPDWMALDLCGTINSSFSKALNEFSQYMSTHKVRNLVVNFSGVDGIDGTGIKLLIMFCVSLRKMNRKITCFGLNEELRQVFHLMRLENFMRIGLDEEQASSIIQGAGGSE